MEQNSRVTRLVGRDGGAVRVMQTWAIEVLAGPSRGQRARVESTRFRIGSHPANDLVLDDPTVSKHHVELRVTEAGYKVVDLSSSNGTFAGGLRIGEATVFDSVVLDLGSSRLRLSPTEEEVEVRASPRTSFGSVLGNSVAMRELFDQLEAVAQSDCSVLLEGETGVGKEEVAESLHKESTRKAGPFVVVDCAALVGELLESELFGHVRGAFSGADADRVGLLESAAGGTVLLDEVGELPLPLQVKLLGALERRKVTPVGIARSRPIDVRVVAATNRELAREVNEARFRADLYYRLAVVRLRVPSLRERLEDVPLLVSSLLAELRQREGPHVPAELSAVALAKLQAQPWPGNVRELRNAVERLVLRLPEALVTEPISDEAVPFFTARAQARDSFERRYFLDLMERPGMNLSRMARHAQLDRRYLQRILRRLGIDPRRGEGDAADAGDDDAAGVELDDDDDE
jgi:DNA-binding NtrC family response regulator